MQNSIVIEKNIPFYSDLLENVYGKEPNYSTKISMLLTEKELRIQFICQYSVIHEYGSFYNDSLYNGDIVEILMMTNEFGKYIEIEVNPKNLQYLALITNDGNSINIQKLDNKLFTSKVIIKDNEITYNIILSLDKLKSYRVELEKTSFNLHRQQFDGDNLELSALSPTMCSRFHRTEAFKKLVINNP